MFLKLCTILSVLYAFINLTYSDQLPTCHPEDFKYAFTECDEYGGRWRVSVPLTPKKCIGGAPNAPTRDSRCYESCEGGTFFNSTSLQCQECEAGYYSLGGGVKYDLFNESSLPPGFNITIEKNYPDSICSGWKVNPSKNLESMSIYNGRGCVTELSYAVKIVKEGKLRFTYQYYIPQDLASAVLFTFHYQNYYDGFNFDYFKTKFPRATNEGTKEKWATFEILMEPGFYIFVWKSSTIGRYNGFFHSEPISTKVSRQMTSTNYGYIKIKNIEVNGVLYASQCIPCENGTFNDQPGGSVCKLCPSDTFSAKPGAISCDKCKQDEYALPGSDHCINKPICGENDYYEIETPCDNEKHTKNYYYKWIEPKICRVVNSFLPPQRDIQCNSTSQETNQLCNAGMQITGDKCEFCPENYYNNGTLTKCQQCPPFTSPLYALSYTIWHSGIENDSSLPYNLSTSSYNEDDQDYNTKIGWQSTQATRHYIRTSPSALPNSYILLLLPIQGFRYQAGGEISFNFQVQCKKDDRCQFSFIRIYRSKRNLQLQNDLINEWNYVGDKDNKKIETFKYRIEHLFINGITELKFGWVFKRNNNFQSFAKIYEILVTNTVNGGAIKCTKCPHGHGENCVPCPYGQYLEENLEKTLEKTNDTSNKTSNKKTLELNNNDNNYGCKRCPQNHIVNTSITFPVGRDQSCIKCGPGLIDNSEGTSCYSNCSLNFNGIDYDLSQIKLPLLLKGGRLFTARGATYYHLFNMTLCGNQGATCVENITYGASDENDVEQTIVKSMICRTTIIPNGDEINSAQAMSLGDELIGISRNTTYKNISVHPEFMNISSDIHFYFVTYEPTFSCDMGRHLTLTLRCVPELDQDHVISTPKHCAEGTCDGCNFHLLVKTRTSAACKVCQSSDYQTVRGECVGGVQEIHYVNPRGCVLSSHGLVTVTHRPCSVIPRQVQIGICLVTGLGVILLSLVFHFWKKNRNLEYKYSKLIENEKSCAESCAVDDDDCDETEVIIHQKKHQISGESAYESIRLTHPHDQDI